MAVPSIRPMTVAEFLEWEEAQPEAPRFELIDGMPKMMAPERARHVRVKTAVLAAFSRAVTQAKLDCEVFNEGLTVPVGERNGYKPDIHITCEVVDDNVTTSERPVTVVEVLSPSTSDFDRGGKLIGYFSLKSVMHYLLVDPIERLVEHHAREGEEIIKETRKNGMLQLDPPGLEVEVADLFETRW